jgi:HSP20 family protein
MKSLILNSKTLFDSIFDDPYFFNEDKQNTDYIVKNEEGYFFESFLPGMNKKNLTIEIDDDIVSIIGDYNSKNEITSDMSYSYTKKYKVPIDVDQSQISANIKDGILRIKFPYSEIKKKKKRVVTL